MERKALDPGERKTIESPEQSLFTVRHRLFPRLNQGMAFSEPCCFTTQSQEYCFEVFQSRALEEVDLLDHQGCDQGQEILSEVENQLLPYQLTLAEKILFVAAIERGHKNTNTQGATRCGDY